MFSMLSWARKRQMLWYRKRKRRHGSSCPPMKRDETVCQSAHVQIGDAAVTVTSNNRGTSVTVCTCSTQGHSPIISSHVSTGEEPKEGVTRISMIVMLSHKDTMDKQTSGSKIEGGRTMTEHHTGITMVTVDTGEWSRHTGEGSSGWGGGGLVCIFLFYIQKKKKNNFVEEKLQSMLKVRDLISFQLFVFVDLRTCTGSQLCPVLSSSGWGGLSIFFKSVMGQTPVWMGAPSCPAFSCLARSITQWFLLQSHHKPVTCLIFMPREENIFKK